MPKLVLKSDFCQNTTTPYALLPGQRRYTTPLSAIISSFYVNHHLFYR